jgi:hypothetical protein
MGAAMKRRGALSDTGVHRLLHGILAESSDTPAYTFEQLMEVSDRRLTRVAASGSGADRLVAERIIGCPSEYEGWEREHARLMQRVATHGRASRQVSALLGVALELMHRKALFEYLRDKRIVGADREKLFAYFRASDYPRACVQEHANYLRSVASFVCVRAIGTALLKDPAFDLPLGRYQAAYTRYFEACCQMVLENAERPDPQYHVLKREVEELREELLGNPAARSGTWRRPVTAS